MRRNKFGAKRTKVDGLNFDSKGEAGRFFDLKLMESAGEISDLRRQVPFQLEAHGKPITVYRADYTYKEPPGAFIVEDYKGMLTPEFKLKAKLFEAQYGFSIRITGAA